MWIMREVFSLVGKPVNSASSTRKSFHAHKQCGTGCVLAGQVASGVKGPPPSRLLTCMLRVRSQAARLSEMATAPVGKYLVERVRPATTSRTAVVSCLCKHREKPRFVRQLPSSFVRFPPPTSTSTRVLNRRLARASLPTVTSLAVLPCAPWARSIVCCSEEPRRPFRRFFRRVLWWKEWRVRTRHMATVVWRSKDQRRERDSMGSERLAECEACMSLKWMESIFGTERGTTNLECDGLGWILLQ
jgi:hypothetical protein